MTTSSRPTAPARRRATAAAALALAALLTVTACSSDASEETTTSDSTKSTEDTESTDAESKDSESSTAGIPESWAASIDDGKERYPGIGSTGEGDFAWACPLMDTVDVDGKTIDASMTTFWKLDEGVHEVECSFYEDTPVSVGFAQAEDEAAYAVLEEATDAFTQEGNEQVQDSVTIGERDYVLVTWTYPTNPKAGPKAVACYLDEDTLSRACLTVDHSDERSEDYDVQQAAEELSAILG